MTKTEAKRIFGGTDQHMADALGVSRTTITGWPDNLRQWQQDRVIGAATRLGLWHGKTEAPPDKLSA